METQIKKFLVKIWGQKHQILSYSRFQDHQKEFRDIVNLVGEKIKYFENIKHDSFNRYMNLYTTKQEGSEVSQKDVAKEIPKMISQKPMMS